MIVLIRIQNALTQLYDRRVILMAYVYIYIEMYCFGLVREVSGCLRVGSMRADKFGWVVADGFVWFWMVSDGFGWFRMVSSGFGWFVVLVVTFYWTIYLKSDRKKYKE